MTPSDPSPEAMERARACRSVCFRCNGKGWMPGRHGFGQVPCGICDGKCDTPPNPTDIARAIDAAVAEAVAKERKAWRPALETVAEIHRIIEEDRLNGSEFEYAVCDLLDVDLHPDIARSIREGATKP